MYYSVNGFNNTALGQVLEYYPPGPEGDAAKASDIIDDLLITVVRIRDQITGMITRGLVVSDQEVNVVNEAVIQCQGNQTSAADYLTLGLAGELPWTEVASKVTSLRNGSSAQLSRAGDALRLALGRAVQAGQISPEQRDAEWNEFAAVVAKTKPKSSLPLVAAGILALLILR